MNAVRRGTALAAVALFCAGVALVRYLTLDQNAPAPSTIDGGNWLTFGRVLLGDDVRSSTIVYPPLVPLLVLGAVRVVGAAHGIALIGTLAAVTPTVGMLIALRGRVPSAVAGVTASLLAVAASTGEAAAWGGYPQLIGFGLAMVFLRAIDDAIDDRSPRRFGVAGLAFAALLATSHLIAGAVLITAAVMSVLHLRAGRGRSRDAVRWQSVALLLGPSLLLMPTYWRLILEILGGLDDRPPFAQLDLADAPDILRHIYRDFEVLWLPLLAVALLTPVALADRWRTPLWRLLVGLLAATAISTVVLHEPRFLYFTALPAVVAAAMWLGELTRRRRVGVAVMAVALCVQTWTGLRLFDEQRDFYAVVDKGVYSAISWLADETPPDSRVAVANATDAPLGWWVEGLTRRKTLVGSPLRWLTFEDEQRRARLANDIFSETFPDEAAFLRADRNAVDYLLVTDRWAGGPRARVRAYARQHPERVVLENASAIVFRV